MVEKEDENTFDTFQGYFQPKNNVPHPQYVCRACNRVGEHYLNDCPSKTDPSYQSLKKRMVTTGIPKTFLRPAVTEEECENAMITADGNLVVYKDEYDPSKTNLLEQKRLKLKE